MYAQGPTWIGDFYNSALKNPTDHTICVIKEEMMLTKIAAALWSLFAFPGRRIALEQFSLEPNKDIAVLSFGAQPEVFAALQSGAVQVAR
jgi:hypothetical protein